MDYLLNYVKSLCPLSDAANNALAEKFEECVFEKGDYLLKAGKVCGHLYFLQHGALRGFYLQDDKEITHWFAFENSFVTSFHSFITGMPAVESIRFLEGSFMWKISKEHISKLLNDYHEIERLMRLAYERYYIMLESRFVNAHFKSATQRYQDLLQSAPHILERVPLGFISSYLGISQETLSRLRRQV